MTTFVMIGRDSVEGAAHRKTQRAAHMEYINGLYEDGRIVLAGPIKSDNGAMSIGAVIVLKADDLESAKALVDADPYVKAGVYESLTVQPFRQALPEPT